MNRRQTISFMIFVPLLTIGGCFDEPVETFVRVQYVSLPGYVVGDYENVLLSENDTLRYTAIANLINEAPDYGRDIRPGLPEPGDEGFESKTEDFHHAQVILGRVKTSLDSPREPIQSAALLFMSNFIGVMSQNDEYCSRVASVTAVGDRALFEQLRLILLHECDAKYITERLIKEGLKSNNWNVHSTALLLLGRIDSQGYQQKVIDDFAKTDGEHDRVLLLQAFTSGYSDASFNFIKQQLIESKPGPMRTALLEILPAHMDPHAVFNWLNESAVSMDPVLLEEIMDVYLEFATPTLTITTQFMSDVLMSDNQQLIEYLNIQELFEPVFYTVEGDDEYQELAPLRYALENSGSIATKWSAYVSGQLRQDELERLKRLKDIAALEAALPAYSIALEEFMEASEVLHRNAGENGELIDQRLISPLNNLKSGFREIENALAEGRPLPSAFFKDIEP